MGIQRDIAQTIVEKDGDYILALKEHQGSLLEMAQYVAKWSLPALSRRSLWRRTVTQRRWKRVTDG